MPVNIIDVVSRMEEAGAAVEDHCECGRPVGDHDYWEDKIYDVNGLRCQANWNREYRHSAIVTKRKRLEAKAAALERLLVTEPSADVIARIVQDKDQAIELLKRAVMLAVVNIDCERNGLTPDGNVREPLVSAIKQAL